MRSASLLLLSLLSSASLVACDGDAPGPEPINHDDAIALCTSTCEHEVACRPGGEIDVAGCTADCADDITGRLRADAAEALFACDAQLACGEYADCYATCVPTPTHEAYEAQCRAALASCWSGRELDSACRVTPLRAGEEGNYEGWSLLCLYTPEIVDAMAACLDVDAACTDTMACLDDVAEAYGVYFQELVP